MKALPSGLQVCSFSIATNRIYNDRDGKRQEAVDYHNITVFGKQAENCAKYLHKGNSAYIEGSLRTNSWEKDGVKHYRTEIVAERVQFGPKGGSNTSDMTPASGASTTQTGGGAPVLPDYPSEDINPEDIPF